MPALTRTLEFWPWRTAVLIDIASSISAISKKKKSLTVQQLSVAYG